MLLDPILGVSYFYGRIPVAWLENDDQEGLQPRVIDYKRLIAIRDHLKKHPQLAPSIGRLINNHLKLFDGQHKLAAQVLNGQSEVDLKIYVAPEDFEKSKNLFDSLMITNLEAHSNLKQIPFYTSTLLDRLSIIYKEMLDEFMAKNVPENHTENKFVEYLSIQRAFGTIKSKEMLRGAIKSAALENSELQKYVAVASKDSSFPISVDLLDKTIFKSTLFLDPCKAKFTSEKDYRTQETKNFSLLSKMLVEETKIANWVPNSKGKSLTNEQRKACRIWHKGAVLTWIPYLESILRVALQFMTNDEIEKKLFRTEFSEKEVQVIKFFLSRLFSHPIWDEPDSEIDSLLVSSQKQDLLFDRKGLSEKFVLNAEK